MFVNYIMCKKVDELSNGEKFLSLEKYSMYGKDYTSCPFEKGKSKAYCVACKKNIKLRENDGLTIAYDSTNGNKIGKCL